MKIIKAGDLKRNHEWVFGLDIACPKCGAIFEIERRDREVYHKTDLDMGKYFVHGNGESVWAACPTQGCHFEIEKLRPELTLPAEEAA